MKAIAAVLAFACAGASAQALPAAGDGPLTPAPAAPAAYFAQRLDAPLPLAAMFTDSTGRTAPLAERFGATGTPPTLLMLGYHRCPQLCGLEMHGLLEALHASGLPTSAVRILFVSVDPTETAADAAARRRVDLDYLRFLSGNGPPAASTLDRLVGPPASIAALAERVGFVYQPGDAAARFAHPAGVVVVTPAGRVSRYLMGIRFDAGELRGAVDDAAGSRIGPLSDRLALLCAHLDPRHGAHSRSVLMLMRAAGGATLALLALLAWRQRAGRPGGLR